MTYDLLTHLLLILDVEKNITLHRLAAYKKVVRQALKKAACSLENKES